jgi:uncharacterized protein DUF6335
MAKKASRRKTGSSSAKRSRKGQKRPPSSKRAGAGGRASASSGAGKRRISTARRNTGRKTAGAKTPRGKKKASAKRSLEQLRAAGARAKTRSTSPRASRRAGGTGMERDLAQTPEAGRSVRGPTNPMPTRRSTNTAAGAGGTKRAPGLERQRKRLRELEETVPTPPSSLDLDRRPSAARSGRHELHETRREHPEVSPELTAGDVDADWQDAYSVGDEAPGGDNPTPDQDRVDDIGKALGVQYEDNEELKGSEKISQRDRHRWELDPASSDDYRDRD